MVIKQNHMSKNLSEIHMWLTQKFIFSFSLHCILPFPPLCQGGEEGEKLYFILPLIYWPLSLSPQFIKNWKDASWPQQVQIAIKYAIRRFQCILWLIHWGRPHFNIYTFKLFLKAYFEILQSAVILLQYRIKGSGMMILLQQIIQIIL